MVDNWSIDDTSRTAPLYKLSNNSFWWNLAFVFNHFSKWALFDFHRGPIFRGTKSLVISLKILTMFWRGKYLRFSFSVLSLQKKQQHLTAVQEFFFFDINILWRWNETKKTIASNFPKSRGEFSLRSPIVYHQRKVLL